VDAAAAPDRLGQPQERRAGGGSADRRRCREAERRLERLDAPTQLVGQDAVDLRERAVGGRTLALEAEPPRRDQSTTTVASSSSSINGGRRNPGRSR